MKGERKNDESLIGRRERETKTLKTLFAMCQSVACMSYASVVHL